MNQLRLFEDGSAADSEIVAGPRKRRRRRAPVRRRRCTLCGAWYDVAPAPGRGGSVDQCEGCTARLARWRADLSGGGADLRLVNPDGRK